MASHAGAGHKYQQALRSERNAIETKKATLRSLFSFFDHLEKATEENLERETRLELATPTLARSCSTN
jgi:hypothetical protein